MRRAILLGVGASFLVVLACNAIVGSDRYRVCQGVECDASFGPDGGPDVVLEGSAGDSGSDATCGVPTPTIKSCDPNKEFQAPEPLPLNGASATSRGGFLSPDGREFYFAARGFDGGTNAELLYFAYTDAGGFGAPQLAALSDASPGDEYRPQLTPDGLRVFFDSTKEMGGIWTASRASATAPWGPVTKASSGIDEVFPVGCHRLYGTVQIGNDYQSICVADWSEGPPVVMTNPVLVPNLNSIAKDFAPIVTPDELHIYFSSDRNGKFQIFRSTRATSTSEWSDPALLPSTINVPLTETVPFYITPDDCVLYYTSNTSMVRATRGK